MTTNHIGDLSKNRSPPANLVSDLVVATDVYNKEFRQVHLLNFNTHSLLIQKKNLCCLRTQPATFSMNITNYNKWYAKLLLIDQQN
jgi:hypothetical protein